MTLRVWHIVTPLVIAVFLLGGAFAYMLGRDSSKTRTRTVVHVLSVPGLQGVARADADSTAQSNVRASIPAVESYYQDGQVGPGDSYAGLTPAKLQVEAPGVSPNVRTFVLDGGKAYCVDDQEQGGGWWHYIGGDPGPDVAGVAAVIARGTCAAATG